MKPWNVNELLFFDKIIESLSKTEAKLVNVRGDVDQNIGYLKRRVLESDAINQDNARSKKRVKENKRKSLKRKHQRNVKSCRAVLHEIIEPKDKAEELIDKVSNCNFDFTINSQILRKDDLFALLKPKIHKAGLHLLIENNVLSDECKIVIETVLLCMNQAKEKSRKPSKKRKTGKQLTTEAAFKIAEKASDNSSSSSTEQSSDEEESEINFTVL